MTRNLYIPIWYDDVNRIASIPLDKATKPYFKNIAELKYQKHLPWDKLGRRKALPIRTCTFRTKQFSFNKNRNDNEITIKTRSLFWAWQPDHKSQRSGIPDACQSVQPFWIYQRPENTGGEQPRELTNNRPATQNKCLAKANAQHLRPQHPVHHNWELTKSISWNKNRHPTDF